MVAAHLLQEVTTRQDNQYGSVVRRLQVLSQEERTCAQNIIGLI
jgi:hypothetical protein